MGWLWTGWMAGTVFVLWFLAAGIGSPGVALTLGLIMLGLFVFAVIAAFATLCDRV